LSDVERPLDKGELSNWEGKYHYEVDLGHPIVTIGLDTLKNPALVKTVKEKLRTAVYFAQLNQVHAKLGVPYFYWFLKTSPDSSTLVPAFFSISVPSTPENRFRVLKELAPSLISLAQLYKQNGEMNHLDAIKTLLSELPPSFFPDVIRTNLPEIMQPKP
jgi:hypothetical protein